MICWLCSKKYEFKRWITDVESGKWMQSKGVKPAAKPAEAAAVAEEEAEVVATLSAENYVTILDEQTLIEWIEKLKKSAAVCV